MMTEDEARRAMRDNTTVYVPWNDGRTVVGYVTGRICEVGMGRNAYTQADEVFVSLVAEGRTATTARGTFPNLDGNDREYVSVHPARHVRSTVPTIGEPR